MYHDRCLSWEYMRLFFGVAFLKQKCSENVVLFFGFTQNKVRGPSLAEICPSF